MWRFVLADLAGTSLGELANLTERRVGLPLNRLRTASFSARLDNPLADELLQGDRLLKVYQELSTGEKRLRLVGPLVTVEEVGEDLSQSLAVTAAGPFFRLGKRLVGKSQAGVSGSSNDQALVASLLAAVNAEAYTGVTMGTSGIGTTVTYGPWHYKPLGEVITELSAALDGFDFEVAPVEPTAIGAGVEIGRLNLSDFIGTERPDTILEYGFGLANVAEYRRIISAEGLMTHGYSLPPSFPDNALGAVTSWADEAAAAARGRYEDVVQSDLASDALRLALVQEHVAIRKQPRQVITFTPTETGPELGVDFEVGDVIRGRAKVAGAVRFDAAFRVYGAEVQVDDVGRGAPALTLIPEDS